MAGASRFSINAVISLIDKMSAPMGYALKSVDNFADTVRNKFGKAQKSATGFNSSVGGIIRGLIGYNLLERGLSMIYGGFKKAVSGAAMFENSIANFTTLLGGSESKAKELVSRLQILGAETPYEFQTLAKTVQTLLPTMDGNIEKTIDTVRMLGDTAGGNAQKLESITRGFTKAMLKGKVDMESLNMIAEAGVPIHTELAKSMGYGKDQMTAFFKKVSSGTVGTDQLVKVFQQMTSEGGLFFGGMIRSSKTFDGVVSNMNDAVNLTFSAIGQEMLPVLKELALSITSTMTSILKWVQANKELIGTSFRAFISVVSFVAKTVWFLRYVILAAVAAYTVFKIAVALAYVPLAIGTAITWGAQVALMGLVIATKAGTVATYAWSAAQRIINFLLISNPIGLVITAIGILAYAIYDLYTNWEVYALRFNVSIQNFVTGFARAKMEVYELLNAIGLISDKDLTGAKLDFLQNFTTGVKLQTEQIRQERQLNGYASPMTGVNNTTTTNGNLGITVSADKGSSASITQGGTMPRGLTLRHGGV